MAFHTFYDRIKSWEKLLKLTSKKYAGCKLTFQAQVKMDGTNFMVTSLGDEIWCSSRRKLITVAEDNLGSAKFASKRDFGPLFAQVRAILGIDTSTAVVLAGEFVGKKIQSGVGLNELSKRFVLFGVATKVPGQRTETWHIWDKARFAQVKSKEQAIYNILDFQSFRLEVDLADATSIQAANKLVATKVRDVCAACPVAAKFGVNGAGEGWVLTLVEVDGVPVKEEGLKFKAKGTKHAVVVPNIDLSEIKSSNELVDKICPFGRLNQALHEAKPQKDREAFLQHVVKDCFEEEDDTIAEAKVNPDELRVSLRTHAGAYWDAVQKQARVDSKKSMLGQLLGIKLSKARDSMQHREEAALQGRGADWDAITQFVLDTGRKDIDSFVWDAVKTLSTALAANPNYGLEMTKEDLLALDSQNAAFLKDVHATGRCFHKKHENPDMRGADLHRIGGEFVTVELVSPNTVAIMDCNNGESLDWVAFFKTCIPADLKGTPIPECLYRSKYLCTLATANKFPCLRRVWELCVRQAALRLLNEMPQVKIVLDSDKFTLLVPAEEPDETLQRATAVLADDPRFRVRCYKVVSKPWPRKPATFLRYLDEQSVKLVDASAEEYLACLARDHSGTIDPSCVK